MPKLSQTAQHILQVVAAFSRPLLMSLRQVLLALLPGQGDATSLRDIG